MSRTRFKRQESWRLKRVKENWRRPRGVTSRMRKEKKGWPALVKVGHGSEASKRGRHPRGLVERLVRSESDLEGLNPKLHIVRMSGRLGEKRRLTLLDRVRSLNIHIANPGREETKPVGEEPQGAGQTPADSSNQESSVGTTSKPLESVDQGSDGSSNTSAEVLDEEQES